MPSHENSTAAAGTDDSKYKQIFRLRSLHLMAFFILIYVGVEVTLGGGCMFVRTAPTRPLTHKMSQDGSSPT